MASSDLKLLGSWSSPFSLRVIFALNIKSVPYHFQQENVLISKSDLLLQSNPVHKKIPVLIHENRPICESLAIVEYIDEAWASGPAILPSDPFDRAVARFWAAYIDNTWFKHFSANLVAEGEDATKAQEETRKGLVVLEAAFVKCGGGDKFFGGDKIGYLDIALGSYLLWIRVMDKVCNTSFIDEFETPNLLKWAKDFCEDYVVKDVFPDIDKLFDFANILASAMKASPQIVG